MNKADCVHKNSYSNPKSYSNHKRWCEGKMEGVRQRMSGKKAENSSHWRGGRVTYKGLHSWISINFGKPSQCEFCKKDGLSRHKIQWANLSHKYLRDRSDWARLCTSCHHLMDYARLRKERSMLNE